MLIDLMGYLSSPKMLVDLTISMASTAIAENFSESAPIILEDIEVLAQLIKASLPNYLTEVAIVSFKNLQASLAAILYPKIILVGCTLFLINSLAFLNNSAAKMTTEVVPSPTSESCN